MTAAPPVLLGSVGLLRSLRADEAPYPGDLHVSTVRPGDDVSHTVWVDAALVADQVWRCDPEGHVLAPIDVARTPGGHAAVLPYCPYPLDAHVRAASRAGEVVTIAVSMLRGAGEASDAGIVCGAWWVDEAGRPVLAAVGSRSWREEGAALLTALATAAFPPLQGAVEGAAAALARDVASLDELRACEDALFAAADPRPLGAPEDLGPISPRSVASLRVSPSPDVDASAESRAMIWLSRFTDAEWAGRVSGVLTDVRRVAAASLARKETRRARSATSRSLPARTSKNSTQGGATRDQSVRESPARRRRAPWIAAAAVGGVVVAGGMLWPEGDPAGDPAGGAAPYPSTGASSTSGTSPSPVEAEPRPAEDADDRIGVVLRELAACAEAATTCPELREDPAATALTGAVVSGVVAATATLLDEYGGVAVYRIEAEGHSAQVLVLVEAHGKWLVRDVYDVADQP